MHKKLSVTVVIDFRAAKLWIFKKKLGFNLHDMFNTKEQTILKSIKDPFEGKKYENSILFFRLQN